MCAAVLSDPKIHDQHSNILELCKNEMPNKLKQYPKQIIYHSLSLNFKSPGLVAMDQFLEL